MITVRKRSDGRISAIKKALQAYDAEHPNCRIDLYRQNSVSVKIRIIDPDFKGVDKGTRHDRVWKYLEDLSEELLSEISILLLLTPDETAGSFANEDFENPIPSRL